jgi:hypothetical protein
MGAGSVFVCMLIALFIDGAKWGADGIRHRVAFILAVSSIRAGWNGSGLDRWTVGQLSKLITELAKTGNDGLRLEHAPDVIGSIIGLVMLYAIGVMMPVKWAKIPLVGGLAKFTFGAGSKGRFDWRLWSCAWALGLMADLTGGIVGGTVNAVITDVLVPLCGHLPDWLFGHVTGALGKVHHQ